MHSGNLIDTVGRDYDLLTQNMEMYLKPHALALQRGCLRPEERHAFEEVLLQALRRTLLEVANQYPGRYGECVAWLQRDHPALLRQARANLKFQRRLLRLRWRQWRGIG